MKKTLRNIVLGICIAVGTAGITANSGCNYLEKSKINHARTKYSELYDQYKSIDMKNLTETEQEVLENTRKAYSLPISVKTLKNEDPDFEESIKAIDNIKAITGKDQFDEKELILLYRQIKDYAGIPTF